jgi:hypothetical protein
MLRSALLLSPDEPLGDDAELFVDQAVIAVSSVICVCQQGVVHTLQMLSA